MSKILATALYPMWTPHFVAELNFIEEHFKKNDDVFLIKCDANLRACSCNHGNDLAGCLRCMGIRDHGLALLSKKPKILPLIYPGTRLLAPLKFRKFQGSIEELKALEFDGFDIGYAAFSPLVDAARTFNPDPVLHRPLIRRLLVDAWATYSSALKTLRTLPFDQVYIFNGRFAAARAWLRACQKLKIHFLTHEISRLSKKALVFENTIPHDLTNRPAAILKFWSEHANDPNILASAHQYFTKRRPSPDQPGISFVARQSPHKLPDGFDPAKKNIAIFSTTERELAGIQDLSRKGIFDSQIEAYLWLGQSIPKALEHYHIYLRIHPNSADEPYRWWEEHSLQNFPNFTIIPPEDPVSTYALLDASQISIVYRSTMGIEATYWGKPSILLAPTAYSKLDAVYEPSSPPEIIELLKNIPAPKPRENALKFSAYLTGYGIELPLAKPIADGFLAFKNNELTARNEIHFWIKRFHNLRKSLSPRHSALLERPLIRFLQIRYGHFGRPV